MYPLEISIQIGIVKEDDYESIFIKMNFPCYGNSLFISLASYTESFRNGKKRIGHDCFCLVKEFIHQDFQIFLMHILLFRFTLSVTLHLFHIQDLVCPDGIPQLKEFTSFTHSLGVFLACSLGKVECDVIEMGLIFFTFICQFLTLRLYCHQFILYVFIVRVCFVTLSYLCYLSV